MAGGVVGDHGGLWVGVTHHPACDGVLHCIWCHKESRKPVDRGCLIREIAGCFVVLHGR